MDNNKKVDDRTQDLFEKYSEAITPAYERAVREALAKHKAAGNPVAVSCDGKVMILQPEEIEIS